MVSFLSFKKLLVTFKLRSGRWRSVRAEHLKDFPSCAVCGTRKALIVHHVRPFHLYPHLELSRENLITLCESTYNCHLLFGHLGDYSAFNPKIAEDSVYWGHRMKTRHY